MKTGRIVTAFKFLLGAVLLQLSFCSCFCFSALAAPDDKDSNAIVEFQQANNADGTFKIVKKLNGQLEGYASHRFRAKIEEGALFEKDKWAWVPIEGEIIDGRISGDRFTITVRYFPFKPKPSIFNGGTYIYEGIMSPGGVVVGDQYNIFTPQSRVKWHTLKGITWLDLKSKPQPPAPQYVPVLPASNPMYMQNEQRRQLNRAYAGKWVLKSSAGNLFTLSLAQNGNTVTGSYQPRNGKIEGLMGEDGRLTYRWSDDGSFRGAGIFVIYDGQQLVGSFSNSPNPNEVAGMWAGGRSY